MGGQKPEWVLTSARYRINARRDSAPVHGPGTTAHGQRPAAHAHGTAHHAPRPAASWARQLRTGHGPRPGPMARDYRPATHGPRSTSGTFTHHGARPTGPGLPAALAHAKTYARAFYMATDNVRARTQTSGPVLSAKKKKTRPRGPGSRGPAGPRYREAVKRAREFSRLRFQNQRGRRSTVSCEHRR